MQRNFAIVLLFVFAAAGAVFFRGAWTERELAHSYKCPEEYSSFDEYARATAASLAAYNEMYPDLTDDEILGKTGALFISHGCEGHTFFAEPPTRSDGGE